jgi:hypothetical protein
MELVVYRDYLRKGTNGALFYCQKLLCYTIELPWKNNQKRVSCIPEGTYKIEERFSEKFGNHLELKNVPNRSLILIHPANNALNELKGCIAPVSKITGEGMGISSRIAMLKLMNEVKKYSSKNEELLLTIKKGNYEISGKI